MGVAVVTLFHNEQFRLPKWVEYYNEYKSDILKHIIVNNGDAAYTEDLKLIFPDSIVLYSKTANMISSYNLGYSEAFKYPEIDAVMQITNDIRLSPNAIKQLHNRLISDKCLGAIGPVLMLPNSQYIDRFGYDIPRKTWGNSIPMFIGRKISEIQDSFTYVSAIPGGVIMTKKSSIEIVGLQDPAINMYCDERDLSIRLLRKGYKEGILKDAQAWHLHQNAPGKHTRPISATYLSARNRLYVTKKYNSKLILSMDFMIMFFRQFRSVIKNMCTFNYSSLEFDKYYYLGLIDGILGKMDRTLK